MKVLFLTTETADCLNHVRAWKCMAPAVHVTFKHNGIRNDWQLIEAAEKARPDVIFYIGANRGAGNPKLPALKAIRQVAPFINLCSDAADVPWHKMLRVYRDEECFNLQVGIDGVRSAPVDLATLTPVDPRPFLRKYKRDIRCGFSGTVGAGVRAGIINSLTGLTVRKRVKDYWGHVRFVSRCRMLLNVSHTGSGNANHVKGRVLEAGWAGCALLESEGSPIADWFPDDCYFMYRDAAHAAELIATLDDEAIAHAAKRLAEEVRNRFSPEMIYAEILEKAGVDHPFEKQAA